MLKLFIALVLTSNIAAAQSADFIVLKKKGRVVQTFFKGSHIEFMTSGGAYRNALINNIKNDSIFLQEFLVNRIFTTLGYFVLDTVGSFRFAYNYKEIHQFGRQHKKFNLLNSGSSLFSGGILLTLGSGISYLGNKNKFSPQLLIAGAGLGTIGYFLAKKAAKPIVVGKRNYTIEYLNVAAKK
jgi:hypothetical protein